MTFADFLPTRETKAAWVAVTELAERLVGGQPAEANPLVLHGPPGCGKTHLAAALSRAVSDTLRMPASELAKPDPPEGARSCHLWIVEDVHRLPERGVVYFDRYLDVRLRKRRATLITSAIGASQLSLPPRVISRLTGGLVIALELPAPPSRRKLLDHLTRQRPWSIEPAALSWLAERIGGVRPLVGAAQELDGLAKTVSGPITLAAVQAHWGQATAPSIESIAQRVAAHFRMPLDDILGRSGPAWPRQVAMALVKSLTTLPAVRIGQHFDGRDASTVRHAAKMVAQRIALDAGAAADWRQLIAPFTAAGTGC